jgi:hypothetical protein
MNVTKESGKISDILIMKNNLEEDNLEENYKNKKVNIKLKDVFDKECSQE